MEPNKIKIDDSDKKIDELADICEYWRKHRGKGYTPTAIKSAIIMICMSICNEWTDGGVS